MLAKFYKILHHCYVVDFGVSAQLDKTIGKRNTFIGTPYWYETFLETVLLLITL